jgi:hypothetical protein
MHDLARHLVGRQARSIVAKEEALVRSVMARRGWPATPEYIQSRMGKSSMFSDRKFFCGGTRYFHDHRVFLEVLIFTQNTEIHVKTWLDYSEYPAPIISVDSPEPIVS